MAIDRLVDQLAQDLRPIRRRSLVQDALVLGAICLAELVLFFASRMVRPDMVQAMAQPSFWWRVLGLGAVAGLAGAVALGSFDPAASPRRGLRWVAGLIGACLVVGWLVDALERNGADVGIVARLDWRSGLSCVWQMAVLSVPAVLGLGWLMRRGAPTDTAGSALSVGIAAAAWGAFVYVFACPVDDPLYAAVWYVIGCGVVTLLLRLVLPPLTRW